MAELIVGSNFSYAHPHSIVSIKDSAGVQVRPPAPENTGNLLIPFFSRKGEGNKYINFSGPNKLADLTKRFGSPDINYDINYTVLYDHLNAGGSATAMRLIATGQLPSASVLCMNVARAVDNTTLELGYVMDEDESCVLRRGALPTSGATAITIDVPALLINYSASPFKGTASDLEDLLDYDGDMGQFSNDNYGDYEEEYADLLVEERIGNGDSAGDRYPIAVAGYRGQGDYGKNIYMDLVGTGYDENGHKVYDLKFYDTLQQVTMETYTGVLDKRTPTTQPIALATKMRANRNSEFFFDFIANGGRSNMVHVLGWLNDLKINMEALIADGTVEEVGMRGRYIDRIDTLISEISTKGLSCVNIASPSFFGEADIDNFLTHIPVPSMLFANHADNVSDAALTKIEMDTVTAPFGTEFEPGVFDTPGRAIEQFFNGAKGSEIYDIIMTPSDYIIDTGYTDAIRESIIGLLATRVEMVALYNAPTHLVDPDDILSWSEQNYYNHLRVFKYPSSVETLDENGMRHRIPMTIPYNRNIINFYVNGMKGSVAGIENGLLSGFIPDMTSVRPALTRSEVKSSFATNRLNYPTKNRVGIFMDGQMSDKKGVVTKMMELHNALITGRVIKTVYTYLDTQRHITEIELDFSTLTTAVNEILKQYAPLFKTAPVYSVGYESDYDREMGIVSDTLVISPKGTIKKHKIVLDIQRG